MSHAAAQPCAVYSPARRPKPCPRPGYIQPTASISSYCSPPIRPTSLVRGTWTEAACSLRRCCGYIMISQGNGRRVVWAGRNHACHESSRRPALDDSPAIHLAQQHGKLSNAASVSKPRAGSDKSSRRLTSATARSGLTMSDLMGPGSQGPARRTLWVVRRSARCAQAYAGGRAGGRVLAKHKGERRHRSCKLHRARVRACANTLDKRWRVRGKGQGQGSGGPVLS